MRPQKIDDIELMEKVAILFRLKGFAGTSLNDISEITGLKKASLYHRFPGGKEEMGKAVFDFTNIWIRKKIIDVLLDKNKDPEGRLETALKNIMEYYQGGEKPCLLRSLSMQIENNLFEQELYDSSLRWLSAFTKLGTDLGYNYKLAEEMALKTVMTLQGGLVLCQTLKTNKPFDCAILEIRTMYKKR